MGVSLKPFAWCLVLLVILGAGAADAKAGREEKKDKDDALGGDGRGPGASGGGRDREDDDRPGARPPHASKPVPEPTPPPASSPPPVASPPAYEPPPVPEEPAPLPTPEATPSPPPSTPSPVLGPLPEPVVPEPADEPSAADERADAGLGGFDAALLALLHAPVREAATLPALVTPTKQPPIAGIHAAALPSTQPLSVLWGLPLAGLVALGIVLSSGRLLQPRPVHATASASAAIDKPPPAPTPVPMVTTTEPLDVPAMLQAAKAAVEAFRYSEAIEWFDRVLLVEPKLAVAHYCRGVCLVGLGRDEEAYEAYRNAHELVPAEGAYRLELARVCGRTGRAGEAMDVLVALLRALPELKEDVLEDPSFASLRDHPRFLMLTGVM